MSRLTGCPRCGGTDHNPGSCPRFPQSSLGVPEESGKEPDLTEEYRKLVDEASEALGGRKSVERFLGLSAHGVIGYRLAHPSSIKREQLLALELLLERVNR